MLDIWSTSGARGLCAPTLLLGGRGLRPGIDDDFQRLRRAVDAIVRHLFEATDAEDLAAAFDEVIDSTLLQDYERAIAAAAAKCERRDLAMAPTDPRRVKRREILGPTADDAISSAEALIGRILDDVSKWAPPPNMPSFPQISSERPQTATVLRDPSVPLPLRRVIFQIIRGSLAVCAIDEAVATDRKLEPWRVSTLVDAYASGADAIGKLFSLGDDGRMVTEETFPRAKRLSPATMREEHESAERWISALCSRTPSSVGGSA